MTVATAPSFKQSPWRTAGVVAACAVVGTAVQAVTFGVVLEQEQALDADTLLALGALDFLLGLLSLPFVAWVQRRQSLAPALVVILLGAFSVFAVVSACYVTAVIVAGARRSRVVLVALVWCVGGALGNRVTGQATGLEDPWWFAALSGALLFGLSALVGLSMRGRVATLRALEREAEASRREASALVRERDAQLAEARADERLQIARDVHDALSHELSVIALHAGAAAHREDLDVERIRAALSTVAESSRRAGAELRRVLVTLREDTATTAPLDLDALPDIVDDAAHHGSEVRLELGALADRDLLPSSSSQQLLRAARECVNNAVRHAPGEPVTITLSGDPDSGVLLQSRNRLAPSSTASPGAGLGLTGLAELSAAQGGWCTAGARDGEFVTKVWVPWPR